jgi:hypothetical protein
MRNAAYLDRKDRQKEAVRLALTSVVSYLWGPPGTGKTPALSVLMQELFERGKRVLICSNTNRAVGQVLFSLCRTLGEGHEAIVHDQLRQQYADYITLEGIVERRSRGLKERKTVLETMVADIARREARVEAALHLVVEQFELHPVSPPKGLGALLVPATSFCEWSFRPSWLCQ